MDSNTGVGPHDLIVRVHFLKLAFFLFSAVFDFGHWLYAGYFLLDNVAYFFSPIVINQEQLGQVLELINGMETNLKSFVNGGFLPFSNDVVRFLRDIIEVIRDGVARPLALISQRLETIEEKQAKLFEAIQILHDIQLKQVQYLENILARLNAIEKK
jgi:hypothetical protein